MRLFTRIIRMTASLFYCGLLLLAVLVALACVISVISGLPFGAPLTGVMAHGALSLGHPIIWLAGIVTCTCVIALDLFFRFTRCYQRYES